jgi:hypothetical protein
MKYQLPKVTEPDENKVHYKADDLSGNATLCGLTDFLYADEKGVDTDEPVNCEACHAVVRYIHKHAKPKDL